jgi:hypothetical protein
MTGYQQGTVQPATLWGRSAVMATARAPDAARREAALLIQA